MPKYCIQLFFLLIIYWTIAPKLPKCNRRKSGENGGSCKWLNGSSMQKWNLIQKKVLQYVNDALGSQKFWLAKLAKISRNEGIQLIFSSMMLTVINSTLVELMTSTRSDQAWIIKLRQPGQWVIIEITLRKEFCAQPLSHVWLMFIHKAEVEKDNWV